MLHDYIKLYYHITLPSFIAILHCVTVLYCNILYYTVSYHIILYYIIL